MDLLDMYLIVKLDDIRSLFCTLAFMTMATGLLSAFIYFVSTDSEQTPSVIRSRKLLYRLAFVGIPLGLLFMSAKTLTPSVKQIAAIIVVPSIVNNKHVKELPDKLLGLANEWIKELSPKKEVVKEKTSD